MTKRDAGRAFTASTTRPGMRSECLNGADCLCRSQAPGRLVTVSRVQSRSLERLRRRCLLPLALDLHVLRVCQARPGECIRALLNSVAGSCRQDDWNMSRSLSKASLVDPAAPDASPVLSTAAGAMPAGHDAILQLRPIWIERADQVSMVSEACRQAGSFALDTEADSLHSYFHKVCLIQVTAGPRHFLVDPLAIDIEQLAPLWEVVADPEVPVLVHGADYDVRILDRDFGAQVGGLLDSQIMAQLLGEPKTGLAALLEKELGVLQDKRHQRADWGQRPVPEAMQRYAIADTAFLAGLVARLKARLDELDRWPWLVEECTRLEGVRYQEPELDPLAFERIKTAAKLKGEARDRCYSLHAWREEEAKARDVPPFRVLGNQQILSLASAPPSSLKELASVRGVSAGLVRRRGKAVLRCLQAPAEAPPRRRMGARQQLRSPAKKRLKLLQEIRVTRASELGIEPGLLLPKALATMIAVADPPPSRAGELVSCGLVGWRLEVLGSIVTELLPGC